MSFVKNYLPNLEIVVEGVIEFCYDSIVPGMNPTSGRHWFFNNGRVTITQINSGGSSLPLSVLPKKFSPIDIGFWSYAGVPGLDLKHAKGDYIRVSLVPSLAGGVLHYVLSPRQSILEPAQSCPDNQPGLRVPNFGPVRNYPPLFLGVWFTDDRYNDLQLAINMWTSKTKLDIKIWPNLPTFPPSGHYRYYEGDLEDGVLASTIITKDDNRPANGDAYSLTRNTKYTFSPPGSRANASEYDFVTVMAHEIGHAIGLDHFGGNIMQPSFSLGEVITTITDEEATGAETIYGV